MNEEEIFEAIIGLPAEKRAAFLDRECSDNPSMRASIEQLLSFADDSGGFAAELAILNGAGSELSITKSGSHIGPFRLGKILGEGGMGVVYRATQTEPVCREVALKIIKPGLDTKEVVSRFRAEQQALAVMDHPLVAKVLEAGITENDRPYFVMELVDGLPITEFCDHHQLSTESRLKLFTNVCKAVQHAHSKSIVHRDIKPTNVLVSMCEGQPLPKVIDFGIAKALDRELNDRTAVTQLTQVLGTPLYMSPEQADPIKNEFVDTRTDIYSLGVLLYELLTGTTPFDRTRMKEAADDEFRRIVREEEPKKPSTMISTLGETATTVSASRKTDPKRLRRHLQGDLDWIVMKALEKERNRRYETASGFADDVQRFLDFEPVQASPPSGFYRFRRMVRRNRRLVTAALTIAALLVLGIVGTSFGLVKSMRSNADLQQSLQSEERLRIAAEQNAEIANRQTEVAREVIRFLNNDLLLSLAPSSSGGKGRDVRMRDVLEEASMRIEESSKPGGRLDGKPIVEAAIRLVLGKSFDFLGLPGTAIPHLERAQSLLTDLKNRGRPSTRESELQLLYVLSGLSGVYAQTGRIDLAEKMNRKAIDGLTEFHSADHSETLIAKNNLAVLLVGRGKFHEASQIFEDLANLKAKSFGETHADTLVARGNQAATWLRLNKLEKADELLTRILPMARNNGDPVAISLILQNLGELRSRQNAFEQAEKMFTESVDLRTKVYGPEHPLTVEVMGYLGILEMNRKDWDKAEENLAKVYEIHRRVSGPASPRTVSIRISLAATLTYLDRWQEAAKLMLSDHSNIIQAFGHDHVLIRRSYSLLDWIAKNLENKGQNDAALEIRIIQKKRYLSLANKVHPNASDLSDAGKFFAGVDLESIRDLSLAEEFLQRAIALEDTKQGTRTKEYRSALVDIREKQESQ